MRDGFLTEKKAASALAYSLGLRGGRILPSVRGIDLAPGPAFVRWELAVGTAICLLGSATLIASRLPRVRVAHGLIALRLASLALALLGAAAVVRSFRTA